MFPIILKSYFDNLHHKIDSNINTINNCQAAKFHRIAMKYIASTTSYILMVPANMVMEFLQI